MLVRRNITGTHGDTRVLNTPLRSIFGPPVGATAVGSMRSVLTEVHARLLPCVHVEPPWDHTQFRRLRPRLVQLRLLGAFNADH